MTESKELKEVKILLLILNLLFSFPARSWQQLHLRFASRVFSSTVTLYCHDKHNRPNCTLTHYNYHFPVSKKWSENIYINYSVSFGLCRLWISVRPLPETKCRAICDGVYGDELYILTSLPYRVTTMCLYFLILSNMYGKTSYRLVLCDEFDPSHGERPFRNYFN